MLFFRKKRLLEMDNKIDSLLFLFQRQQEQVDSFSQRIRGLENQQDEIKKQLDAKIDTILNDSVQVQKKYLDEINAQFDSLINRIDISSEETQNNQNLLKDSLNILQREINSTIEEVNEKILNSNKIEKDFILDKIEKCKSSIKQDLERSEELENLQIENLKKDKLEMKQYILEKLEENRNRNIEEIVKQIENSLEGDMQKILTIIEERKNLIIEMIERNNDVITQNMESLDSGLRMLLLNSIMEQLSQE